LTIQSIAGAGLPDERDDDFSDDVDETTSQLGQKLQEEMGVQEAVAQLPPSPIAKRRIEDRPITPLKRTGEDDGNGAKKSLKTKKVKMKTNSEMFPAHMRPEIFEDDEMFNQLGFEKASTFVHEHTLLKTKMKMKDSGKNSQEKCDDVIKKVKIPEGEDDAGETVNIEARKALRPMNKEIGDQMSWMVTKYEQVVRNLPLEIYDLADCVPTKAIELAHNLSSQITIDMFCPGGKKNSNVKQKAMKTKNGELAVETIDVYGDLDSIQDVQLAWNTLQSIWQKIFPEWPVAIIAQRVIIKMKNFAHCNYEAKEILIKFSNRLLTSNAQRAARKKKPLPYDRAWSLAGVVCNEQGYSKEPPAMKGNRIFSGGQAGGFRGAVKDGQGSQGAARGGIRTSRGGGSVR
jgi:hypothetical protein